MKTFAITLSLLVLAVIIQDALSRPQHGDNRGGTRRRPGNQRGGPGGGCHGCYGGHGGHGSSEEDMPMHSPICLVENATTNEELCSNAAICPSFAKCELSPLNSTFNSLGLRVHVCVPQTCDPAAQDPISTCPNNTICRTFHSQSICLPDHDRFEEVEDTCADVVDEVINLIRNSRSKTLKPFQPCAVTATEGSCKASKPCPPFAPCSDIPEEFRRFGNVPENVQIQMCLPLNCTGNADICPENSVCESHHGQDMCLPEERKGQFFGGRSDDSSEEDFDDSEEDLADQCEYLLEEVLSHGRLRGGGRRHGNNGRGQGRSSTTTTTAPEGNGPFGTGNGGQDNGPFPQLIRRQTDAGAAETPNGGQASDSSSEESTESEERSEETAAGAATAQGQRNRPDRRQRQQSRHGGRRQ